MLVLQFFVILMALLTSPRARAADFSITMDDFNVEESTMLSAKERNDRILATLKKYKSHAALFVVGKYAASDAGKTLLKAWDQQGHLIGNHTFSHPSYNRTSFAAFKDEIERCEAVLKNYRNFAKFFRFPTLAEGETAEKRDQLRAWLKDRGYRLGEVTIDASDWYIDQRMRARMKTDPRFDLTRYRDYYLNHMWERASYYNNLSKRVLGHEVKHTLLVHFNLLNALFLGDLLELFAKHGWTLVDAQEAFKDPVFDKQPKSMPSGQSLLWALAKEDGRFAADLRYPGEDDIYEKPKMDQLGL